MHSSATNYKIINKKSQKLSHLFDHWTFNRNCTVLIVQLLFIHLFYKSKTFFFSPSFEMVTMSHFSIQTCTLQMKCIGMQDRNLHIFSACNCMVRIRKYASVSYLDHISFSLKRKIRDMKHCFYPTN